MTTLYDIDQAILECIDDETGEIIDEEKLNQLQMERDRKIENVALWHKNLVSDAEVYGKEKKLFAEKEAAAKKKAAELKEWLSKALGGDKFKSARVNISYRKSESVNVVDITKLDKDYLKLVAPEVDKTKVKEALKDGVQLEGVELIQKNNIQIR